jgi:hypothetical protein
MNEPIETKTSLPTIYGESMELGKIFADSEVFPDIKTAAQGCIKVLAGRELGMTPLQSLNAFYFVSGKLAIVTQTVAALIKKSGKYDYSISNHTAEECAITFYKINGEKEEIGMSKFDLKMAAKAGIVNKDNWKNYPMNMLFARALMNGVRWFCPDVMSASIYSVEELQDLNEPKPETILTLDDSGIKEEGKNE